MGHVGMSNETVDKIRALKSEVERLSTFQKQNHSGYSTGGVNVWGDASSMDWVRDWHRAFKNEAMYRETIRDLRKELAEIKEALG